MKRFLLILISILLFIPTGCSSSTYNMYDSEGDESYNDGYDSGYEDGYDSGHIDGYDEGYDVGYEQSFYDNVICSEEINDFKMMIVNLMYDYEYEVVKKLSEYYPEGVESALELEFGITDLDTVIEYLEELSQTVIGLCEVCGKEVYADEFFFPPDGIECAHHECIYEDSENGVAKIEKGH